MFMYPQSAEILSASQKIRILVAEDNSIYKKGLCSIILQQPDMLVIGEASDGEEAIKLYEALHPDVVLMDLRMPRVSGLDAIRKILERWPEAKILIITFYSGESDCFAAQESGALGHILKDSDCDEIWGAIRSVFLGHRHVSKGVAERLVQREERPKFSDRETQVLRCIMEAKKNQEIAEELHIALPTVKLYVSGIFRKLGVNTRSEVLKICNELGLMVDNSNT